MLCRLLSVTVIALTTVFGANPAFACKGSTLLFSDSFKEADPAWSQDGGTVNIANGRMQIESDAGYFGLASYQGSFFPTGDVCVDVVAPDVKDQTSIIGGIAFADKDFNNFYVFAVRPDGSAIVLRHQNGGWLTPIPAKKMDAIKTGSGVDNLLRLTVKDGSASAYVNDQLFYTFKIQNEAAGKVGLYVESAGLTYSFMNIKVTN
jgi:hypothetical protein